MPTDPDVVAALRAAIASNPESLALWLHLARVLLDGGQATEALEVVGEVLSRSPANVDALSIGAEAAGAAGDPDRSSAYRRLLDGLATHSRAGGRELTLDEGSSPTFEEIVGREFGSPPASGPVTPEYVRSEWEVEQPTITLAAVAGMEAVKRRLQIAFLAPLRNPDVMKAYGMTLRGGLLLYGPPGCGKTYLARATAGELGSRFIAVGLPDVLDMWLGESERKLHEIFEEARRHAPCVLFFDEIDALGQKRSQLRMSPGIRNVVNQLLAELDGVATSNEGVFVLGATNHPWDVDTALRRPGRFDRLMLVLPPDEPAREAIIRLSLDRRPVAGLDPRWIAAKTEEFSGADLVHLCQGAAEAAMEESLRNGTVAPITPSHVKAALAEVHPSTRPWFEIARNYAQFANEGGMYDDLLGYIREHRI